jgi:hypothetical protein
MNKLKQNKIPMTLTEDNLLKIAVEQGAVENEFNWKLVREQDGLTKKSKEMGVDINIIYLRHYQIVLGTPKAFVTKLW